MPGCLRMLREEFRLKKFGYGNVYPERFHMWQWRVPPLVYLLYRLTLAVYVDVWMIISFSKGANLTFPGADSISWAAFLTNWTYAVLALYLTTHCIATSVHYLCFKCRDTNFLGRPLIDDHQNIFPEIYSGISDLQGNEYEPVRDFRMEEVALKKLPWYLIIVWILFNVVSSSAVMVTLIFFTALLPQLDGADGLSLDNIQLHMLNSVFVFVEHLVSGIPVRLLHVIYPITYGLVYMFFSLFYWIPDHDRTMYPNILDWNHAGTTVGWIVLIGFVIIPLLHVLFFIMYRVKLVIHRKLGN